MRVRLNSVVMMVPAAFLLVFGVARLWILSKRNSLPLDMTSNWLYFAKMVCDVIIGQQQ